MTTGSSRPYAMNVREKSCFCIDCIEDNANIDQCENIRDGYVSQWEMKQLISMPPFVEDDNVDVYDPLYSADYERVSDLVVIGDIFAIVADPENAEGVDYYLLRCTQPKSKLFESMTDGDGQEYPIGSVVIEGTYYQQIKIDKNGIIFVDYRPGQKVLHYSHLVLATKINLETLPKRGRAKQKWRLPIEDHEKILEIIKDREDPDFMYQEL